MTILLKSCIQSRRHSEELAGERRPDGEGLLGRHQEGIDKSGGLDQAAKYVQYLFGGVLHLVLLLESIVRLPIFQEACSLMSAQDVLQLQISQSRKNI